MDSSNPVNEQKTLAAIVFTDGVDFSRLSREDESGALRRLNNDFEIMRTSCATHNGVFVKTMGDGSLMRFNSATDALGCALDIQKTLADNTAHNPILHRISVHLGDVLITESDVLGDGVNVASRLQSKARPGSIWMSRIVRDTVPATMAASTRRVGAVPFKGIDELIEVFEVPPLWETRNQRPPGAPTQRRFAFGVATMLALVLFCIAVVNGVGRQNALGNTPTKVVERVPAPPTQLVSNMHPAVKAQVPPGLAPLMPQLKPLFAKNRFEQMANLVADTEFGQTDAGMQVQNVYVDLGALTSWIGTELTTTSKNKPLDVQDDPLSNGPISVYAHKNGTLAIDAGNGPTQVKLSDLPKARLCAIATAFLNKPGAVDPDTRAAVRDEITEMMRQSSVFQ